MFYCVLVTFPDDVPGKVWYLIVSIPDLCFLHYFYNIGAYDSSKLYSMFARSVLKLTVTFPVLS